MLSDRQNDLVGLSFDVETFDFFNVSIDISSIDLSTFTGPFTPVDGIIPVFEFTLYDNPSGATSLQGNGVILDSFEVSGTASERTVFDWTTAVFGLETAGNTNGNVTLGIDLLEGEYASFDNLLLTADDNPPDTTPVTPPPSVIPVPAALPFLLTGLLGFGVLRRRKKG